MTRKITGAAVAAVLLLGGAAGEGLAKPRRYKVQRTDSGGYVGSRGGTDGGPEVYVDEVVFETERNERSVSLTIADRAGQTVAASVRQDVDGDGTFEVDEPICGATAAPVKITGGAPVVVKVQPGPCADGTPAVMTSGRVLATFTGFTRTAPAVAPAPSCKAAQPREVTETYQSPGGAGAADQSYPVLLIENGESEALGGAEVGASCETKVDVVLDDATGLPVRAVVAEDPDGLGPAEPTEWQDVCGATAEPIEIAPYTTLLVQVIAGPCADGTPAAATTGTVTATFAVS